MGKDDSLQLMDGTMLKCVPRAGGTVDWPSKEIQCAECELFVKNAHFLLANRKRIFSDSKLFLTPVRIRSGLAYVGNFTMPCLGGYLEWWLNSEFASKGEGDERELVYSISGSPLSGHNVSRGVRKDGSTCACAPGSVLRMAQSYCVTMRRYSEPMRRFESHTLAETLAILKGGQSTCENSVEKIVLEQKVKSQAREIEELKASLAQKEKMVKSYTAALARAVVREYADDVQRAIDQADALRASMNPSANKGAANRPIEVLFRSFAKREGVVLCAPSRRFLLEELARRSGSADKAKL